MPKALSRCLRAFGLCNSREFGDVCLILFGSIMGRSDALACSDWSCILIDSLLTRSRLMVRLGLLPCLLFCEALIEAANSWRALRCLATGLSVWLSSSLRMFDNCNFFWRSFNLRGL